MLPNSIRLLEPTKMSSDCISSRPSQSGRLFSLLFGAQDRQGARSRLTGQMIAARMRLFLGEGQYDRFIALLRKAKTMDIEVDFYGEGSQVVTFDVHGLQEW
jgi:hypothetical protein